MVAGVTWLTQAQELGDAVLALTAIQAGLGLALINLCRHLGRGRNNERDMSTRQGSLGALSVDTGKGGLQYVSWGHQGMVVTTAHWDGAPGLSGSLALLTIAFGGVAPDARQAADAGMVVLTERVAQLTLVFC